MDDRLQHIAHTLGYESQSRQCIEEMSELIQAINKHWRKTKCDRREGVEYCQWNENDGNILCRKCFGCEEYNNLIEEIADVQIMIEQMKILLHCECEVYGLMEEKINRQVGRIIN